MAFVEEHYGPGVDGINAATERFVLEIDGVASGMFQRYRNRDHADWVAAINDRDGAGIDYLIGDVAMTGRGIGSAAIGAFTVDTFAAYPEVPRVMAAPQQSNVASWRALEKAGFHRVWAGQLDSDDPSDAGPAFLYVAQRVVEPAPAP